MGNTSLRKAQRVKDDEFYTQIGDIEKELKHYKEQLKGKTVFCNCDDPEESNFWLYFRLNFHHIGLKKLISTHYEVDKSSYKLEYNGEKIIKTNLEQNGDFRSPECIEIMKESDIICTNPPFSLFREYLAQLIKYEKSFLIIGSQNAITYQDVFELLKDNKTWLGNNSGDMEFMVPSDYEPRKTRFRIDENGQKWRSFGNICWYTNLETIKRSEKVLLYKEYNEEDYPKYDNYDAINVDKVKEIPIDYQGLMGVPITFMHKHNPKQFEIIDALNRYSLLNSQGNNEEVREARSHMCNIDGKPKYFRIVIKKK